MYRFGRRLLDRAHIEGRIRSLTDEVLRPNDKFGYVPSSTYDAPMVLLLGNHSAGKSTFINSILGREEQQTGVAPTDDGFTVLLRGDVDMDQDGPSAVSDPRLKFEDLRSYGMNFVSHFKVKTRILGRSSNFPAGTMIVDSPGMVDTPVHHASRTSLEGQNRGYDFIGAVRWFAQRSDVILLMFDPANPGTTGETLDVLTQSLAGLEHKFLIVLNKVDVFEKVTDFARAYGTLCWNISKVIQMKDVPRIYTTYTPLQGPTPKTSSLAVPADELNRVRTEILQEVLKAPLRRLDNLITEMDEAAKRIVLTAKVAQTLKRRYLARSALCMAGGAGICLGLPIAVSTVTFPVQMTSIVATLFLTAGGIGGTVYALNRHLREYADMLVRSIDSVLDEHFPGKLKTHDVTQRWSSVVREQLVSEIKRRGIPGVPTPSIMSMRAVERVISTDVPDLRSQVGEYKVAVLKQSAPQQQQQQQ